MNALRIEGHDVLSVREVNSGAEDEQVIAFALREKRLLLTEDKDFGQLVYAYGKRTIGVIFLRYQAPIRQQMCQWVVKLVEQQGETLQGCFVTVQIGRARISRPPSQQ